MMKFFAFIEQSYQKRSGEFSGRTYIRLAERRKVSLMAIYLILENIEMAYFSCSKTCFCGLLSTITTQVKMNAMQCPLLFSYANTA